MRVHYDEEIDAFYLDLDDSKVIESEEVSPGIIFDFNDQNQIVGVEILWAKRQLPLDVVKILQKQAMVEARVS